VSGPGPAPWPSPVAWGPGAAFGTASSAPGSPGIRPRELVAIRALRLAAVLGIVGLVLGVVVPYAIALSEGSQSPFSAFAVLEIGSGGNTSTLTVSSGVVWTLVALVVLASAIGLAGLLFYRRCFDQLRSIDRDFSTPSTLTVVLMAGLVLLVVAVVALAATLVSVNGCTFGGPTPPACATNVFSTLVLDIVVLGVAGILSLVGLIGLLLGIWRVGTRYNSTLLHVAAILYVIPFASFVAPILTFLEARAIERRIAAGPSGPGSGLLPPPGFPAPPLPPSPSR
jgi:uncharacterized membrane protein YidH (DUF202 family)